MSACVLLCRREDDLGGFFKQGHRNVESGKQADFVLGGEAEDAVFHTGLYNFAGRLHGFQPEHQSQTGYGQDSGRAVQQAA